MSQSQALVKGAFATTADLFSLKSEPQDWGFCAALCCQAFHLIAPKGPDIIAQGVALGSGPSKRF